MGVWVLVWCRGRGGQNKICFSLKMKGERAFTVLDICLFQELGCVYVYIKEKFTFDPGDLGLLAGSFMRCDCTACVVWCLYTQQKRD